MSCNSGIVLSTEGAQTCSVDTGACDDGCGSRCSSSYPGGQGTCSLRSQTIRCVCYFDCGLIPPPGPRPKPKTCHSSLVMWGSKCDDEKCNKACAEKYAGPGQQGRGYCYWIAEPMYTQCYCDYNC